MRQDDPNNGKRYFRSGSRVFRMNDQWWASTREGELGPFDSEKQAQLELNAYISKMQAINVLKAERERNGTDDKPQDKGLDWDNVSVS